MMVAMAQTDDGGVVGQAAKILGYLAHLDDIPF
jgi:hypothetical protein